MIRQIDPVWNPRRIYIGGGNAKHLEIELPAHVRIVSIVTDLLGGVALLREA